MPLTVANGRAAWECYVAGLDPTDAASEFRVGIEFVDGAPAITWSPDLGTNRVYTVQGKDSLTDATWGATNGTSRFFRVKVEMPDLLGGVQLWENGPYWAECNVGATKPEEYGYYFWWGDTVGYTPSGGTWTDDWYYSGVTWVSSTGEQMSRSSFTSSSCPTYGKDNSTLLSEGWIDATGNLAPEHDAAAAHLGSPWRMPTDDEIQALFDNCTTEWITTNGVSGRLVTGKGDYSDRSIFLPAAGHGVDSGLDSPGSYGYYWSSSPHSGKSGIAWYLLFYSGDFIRLDDYRCGGRSVRPVRDPD